MAMAAAPNRFSASSERIARAAFIGLFFAPVAGAFTGTLTEAIRYWNAEPGGIWAVPVLMGLSDGFLRGTVTGLTFGVLGGWPLSALSLGRGMVVLLIAALFSSSATTVMQALLEPMPPQGATGVSSFAASLAWVVGAVLIGIFVHMHRTAARKGTP